MFLAFSARQNLKTCRRRAQHNFPHVFISCLSYLLHFLGFWVLFSDSLAFFTSIALFFVPKDPLGSDNGPKQNFQKKIENLSYKRLVSPSLTPGIRFLFLKFCFGPKSGPRGSFGTKKSAIDAENARESENWTQNPQKYKKKR